jgi:hypothetical protein
MIRGHGLAGYRSRLGSVCNDWAGLWVDQVASQILVLVPMFSPPESPQSRLISISDRVSAGVNPSNFSLHHIRLFRLGVVWIHDRALLKK